MSLELGTKNTNGNSEGFRVTMRSKYLSIMEFQDSHKILRKMIHYSILRKKERLYRIMKLIYVSKELLGSIQDLFL